MASKYIQKFPIPDHFSEILSDLTREILRNQPQDIIDFSAQYFKCLQEGVVLDYDKKGANIPNDFKVSIPKGPSEKVKEKKEVIPQMEEKKVAPGPNENNVNI